MKTKYAAGILALIFFCFLYGCGKSIPLTEISGEKYQERADKVVICVDYVFVNSATTLLECMKQEGNVPDIEFEVLPVDETLREAKMIGLRTALMAGSGPDAFIFFNMPNANVDQNYGDPLFSDPAKAMWSGCFLPLDDLIADSKYIDPDKLNKALLAAGQTTAGQVILPLMYTVPCLLLRTSALSSSQYAASTWQEMSCCSEPLIGESFLLDAFPAAFPTLADYEDETLLISRDELSQRFREAALWAENSRGTSVDPNDAGTRLFNGEMVMMTNYKGGEYQLQPVRNSDGGVTAFITMAAAVNANSKHVQEAFSFLEMFFHPQVLSGKGFRKNMGAAVGNLFYQGYIFLRTWQTCGVPVPLTPRSAWSTTPQPYSFLTQLDTSVTSARFYSGMDVALTDAFQKGSLAGRLKGKEIDKIAGQCYDLLEMMLCE